MFGFAGTCGKVGGLGLGNVGTFGVGGGLCWLGGGLLLFGFFVVFTPDGGNGVVYASGNTGVVCWYDPVGA